MIEIKIYGLNLARLINKLLSCGVIIQNLVTKKKLIKFKIFQSDLEKLDKVCKSERKSYKIVSKTGPFEYIKRVPYLIGTLVALVICFSYIFSFSSFVFVVDAVCSNNENYDMSEVNSVLRKNEIVVGMRRKDVDISEIQTTLLLMIDDIEACTVELCGGKLKVSVFASTEKYEISTENVVSLYNAVIVSAECYVGTLKVKAGDVVQVGDVLIENNGDGAMGKILAKVYFTSTKIYNSNQQEIVQTGNYQVSRTYTIFGKNLSNDNFECKFTHYLEKNCVFYLMRNFFLPIVCTEKIYYETEIVEKTIPFDDVKEEIYADLYDEARSLLPESATESGTTYSVVTEGTYTRVDCFIETILNIA